MIDINEGYQTYYFFKLMFSFRTISQVVKLEVFYFVVSGLWPTLQFFLGPFCPRGHCPLLDLTHLIISSICYSYLIVLPVFDLAVSLYRIQRFHFSTLHQLLSSECFRSSLSFFSLFTLFLNIEVITLHRHSSEDFVKKFHQFYSDIISPVSPLVILKDILFLYVSAVSAQYQFRLCCGLGRCQYSYI